MSLFKVQRFKSSKVQGFSSRVLQGSRVQSPKVQEFDEPEPLNLGFEPLNF
jgi:hypothetical protein